MATEWLRQKISWLKQHYGTAKNFQKSRKFIPAAAAGMGVYLSMQWLGAEFVVWHDIDTAQDVLQRVKAVAPPPKIAKYSLSQERLTQQLKRWFYGDDGTSETFSQYDATTADMCLTIINARNKLKKDLQSEATCTQAQNYTLAYENNKQAIAGVLSYISSGMSVDLESEQRYRRWQTWPLFQEDALVLANMKNSVDARNLALESPGECGDHRQGLLTDYFRRILRFTTKRINDFASRKTIEASSFGAPRPKKTDPVTGKGAVYSDWVKQVTYFAAALKYRPPPLLWYEVGVRPDRFVQGSDSFEHVTEGAKSVLKSGGSVRFLLVLPHNHTRSEGQAAAKAARMLNEACAAASVSSFPSTDQQPWARIYVEKSPKKFKGQDILFLSDESHGGECMIRRSYTDDMTSQKALQHDFFPAANDVIFADNVSHNRKQFDERWNSAVPRE